jgi:hypothetical protein
MKIDTGITKSQMVEMALGKALTPPKNASDMVVRLFLKELSNMSNSSIQEEPDSSGCDQEQG